MEKKKRNLVKNYLILFLIFAAVVAFMLYMNRWYVVYTEYKRETPIIRDALNYEISAIDFESYIMENPSSVIYACTSQEERCRSFEKDFKKLITKKGLQDSIIYLNLSDTDIDKFVDNFNNKYEYKIKITSNYPLIVEFRDGKITSLIEGTKDKPLTMTKVKQFIEINNIGKTE